MNKHYYITTAIDYANGLPHLGHAYEKVLTDVTARYQRLKGLQVHFLTGLDEHGQKVQQAAHKQNIPPQQLCDSIAESFKSMCKRLEISNNDYIRTTEERHKKVVHEVLQKLYDQGDIYKADYKGYYSTKEEQFLQEKDRVDGKWPAHYGDVSEISESNYFFKLSKHRDWLVKYIQENPDFIFPKFRAKQVLEFVKEDLNDLCISRPKERLSWGIELPFDPHFVTYVWFDALLNYLSAIGYGSDQFDAYWPADCHVIGKDILVPAHGVYWPIILKAMGLRLPKQLIVHGWWLQSGEKMSKSIGNVIDPLNVIEQFGADPFRYFLIREMHVGQDSDFSLQLFLTRYTSDLGNDLGNLVSRLLNMGERYCGGILPKATINEEAEQELKSHWQRFSENLTELFDGYQFHKALDELFGFIRGINRYAELRAPWKLAKSEDPSDQQKLQTSLAMMAEGLRLAALVLLPVMPTIASKILTLIGSPKVEKWQRALSWSNILEGKKLGEKCILFPRIETEITK